MVVIGLWYPAKRSGDRIGRFDLRRHLARGAVSQLFPTPCKEASAGCGGFADFESAGRDECSIRIRGTRSLTATNDPLVVLDVGSPFPGSLGRYRYEWR